MQGVVLGQWFVIAAAISAAPVDGEPFADLEREFSRDVSVLLNRYCADCHGGNSPEGDLDLQRFTTLADIRREPAPWIKVQEMLRTGDMPPADSPQPSVDHEQRLSDWVDRYLTAEAAAHAGDPGPVVLRRLNNAEYTYTIQDLTGVALDPTRDFPVDGAAGEGFTNTGAALSMSPALVEKYLAAAREVAAHAVLLPDGIAFSEGTTPRDWSNERVDAIREIYRRHTSGNRDVSRLDRWSVPDVLSATAEDGRWNITPYIAAMIARRDLLSASPAEVDAFASREGLNAKYLRHLITELPTSESPLLRQIAERLANAEESDSGNIAAEILAWQQVIWKFNAVGHLGPIRPWQEPVDPIVPVAELRIPIGDADNDGTSLHLAATSVGSENTPVIWRNPRFERPGKPAVPLRDVRGGVAVLNRLHRAALSQIDEYLATAPRSDDGDLDPRLLRAWRSYLGIETGGDVQLGDRLHLALRSTGGYEFVRGWGLPDADALSVVANSSDDTVNIPGELRAHRVAVHPRPERSVAVGWKCPIEGAVRIEAHVRHAHPACGNGVAWSIDHRRGNRTRVLRSGAVDLGGRAEIEPVASLTVQSGDVVSLIIGARDRSHVCDLTEIDLVVRETGGEERVWSLSADCANNINAANPHADAFGNADVWHFYSEVDDESAERTVVPEGSLLARWLDEDDPQTRRQLAAQLQTLISMEPGDGTSPADAELYQQLTALDGPVFVGLDLAALAADATPSELAQGEFGIDPASFANDANELTTVASSITRVKLPAQLFAGAEFVVTGVIDPSAGPDASAQFHVSATEPQAIDQLQPGISIVATPGSAADSKLREAFTEFRNLFPAAMCYARIVPVDEVVTLVLYHREDEHLQRLMLDDAEAAELDRLWDELHYVSRDAVRIEVALEQILEFATQDADPARFDPVREPIAQGAAAFRERLVATQPVHIDAVLRFAAGAWRRPLTDDESTKLRDLYQAAIGAGADHDAAVRMLLARVLASPAFLYRLETPGPGEDAVPVSDRELANRLSYFFWSSVPDDELRTAVATEKLSDPDELRRQARRMLADERIRRLAIEFACQWLHIRDFASAVEKNERLFPEFTDLRDDMREESVRFLTDLFQNDRSVLSLLDADHTFLNEALAAHYGITGVSGNGWLRVDDLGDRNAGILTQATILASQSGASRTSPILRGNWVSETLLGESLPRPPPNVPVLPETVPEGLTERQLIERHSSVAECAKCHARIDPYGFALENFDTVGRFRRQTTDGNAIDVRTTLKDGTNVDGVGGLRDYLLTTRRDDFLRQFCRKLLGYALGRAVILSDRPLIDEILQQWAENDYRVSVAVEAIVMSPQFRMIRGGEQVTTQQTQ